MSLRSGPCGLLVRVLPLLVLGSLLAVACSDERPLSERARRPGPSDLGPADGGSKTELDEGAPPAPDLGPGPADLEPEPVDLAEQPADLGLPADTGGGDEDQGGGIVDAGLPPLPVAVDTLLPVAEVAAGTPVRVTCQVTDSRGNEVSGLQTLFLIHPENGYLYEVGSDTFEPQWAGEYLVTCHVPSEGLRDDTPAALLVVPGPVHTVITEVDRDSMIAGETSLATCAAYDAFGNPIELELPVLSVDPGGEGITVSEPPRRNDPFPVTITRAGFYHMVCPAEGAVTLLAAALRVEPDLPARLAVSVSPARRLYRTGEVVTLLAEVTDVYDNPVPGAVVERSSAPAVPQFGFGRFRFDRDGRFTLTATVTGETRDGVPLSAGVTVDVSTFGPTIDCLSPTDGGVADIAPGQNLELVGQVADPNGVRRVLLDGAEVPVDAGGLFRKSVATRFGINFVELIAEDVHGMQSSSFCSYLVANRWDARDAFLGDSVSFRLGQPAVDDGLPDRPLASIADILRRVVNSPGLVDTVNGVLVAANPLYKNCEWTCPIFGGCCMDVEVRYRPNTFRLPGPNTLALTLVDGGLSVSVRVPHPSLEFVAEITGPDVDGRIGVTYMDVSFVFDARLEANGRPAVRLRPGSERVVVGEITHDLNWWIDWLVSIVNSLFGNYFRGLIADAIKGQLRDNIDSALDGVLGNLDISALGQQLQVPSLTGGPPVTIGVGVNFTRAEFNPQRALFGFGLRLMGPVNVRGDVNGAPIPPGALSFDPGAARSLGAAVSYGVLEKALFTMWQAGYLRFDAAQVVPGLEDAPAGTQLSLAVSLPPVVRAGRRNGELIIGLGGARMVLAYPTIFDTPIEIFVAAEATAGATLVGERELQFRQVTVDRLLFRTPNVALEPVTRALLQDLLTQIIQHILDRTINGALPVLPIPDFALPDSLVPYGIPRGTRLGLRAPQMETTATHFVVRGNLGEW